MIGVKENHLKQGDNGDIVKGIDDVVDLVAAVQSALRSWDSVMRKQNNSPSTDKPDDSSPDSFREKHVKRSTYHNKNSQNQNQNQNQNQDLDGKKVEFLNTTEADSPESQSQPVTLLNDSTIITENPIKKSEVASDVDDSLGSVSSSDKKSTSTVASISLLCVATILSIGAVIFLRRKA